ncbi:MAG: hypothetical protein GVY30_06310 [Chloroflexi bacterium]|nr:hypothetical protein [Chloroflexota bacterium]
MNGLVRTVMEVAGKDLRIQHVEGPVGVQARIHSLGWEAEISLREGIERTYPWVLEQVRAVQSAE